MSQKKVDEYKNYKKNRRENIKKEKREERLTMAAMWGAVVVFIACVGGAMGVSIYNKYQAKQAALPTYGSTSFILSDMAGIIRYYNLQMVRPKIAHSQLKIEKPRGAIPGLFFLRANYDICTISFRVNYSAIVLLCQILFNVVENFNAVIFCSLAEILFNAQQLVVFGNTVGTGRSTGLIWPAFTATAISARVVSSVSPLR